LGRPCSFCPHTLPFRACHSFCTTRSIQAVQSRYPLALSSAPCTTLARLGPQYHLSSSLKLAARWPPGIKQVTASGLVQIALGWLPPGLVTGNIPPHLSPPALLDGKPWISRGGSRISWSAAMHPAFFREPEWHRSAFSKNPPPVRQAGVAFSSSRPIIHPVIREIGRDPHRAAFRACARMPVVAKKTSPLVMTDTDASLEERREATYTSRGRIRETRRPEKGNRRERKLKTATSAAHARPTCPNFEISGQVT
jgi:hypothetical protein